MVNEEGCGDRDDAIDLPSQVRILCQRPKGDVAAMAMRDNEGTAFGIFIGKLRDFLAKSREGAVAIGDSVATRPEEAVHPDLVSRKSFPDRLRHLSQELTAAPVPIA